MNKKNYEVCDVSWRGGMWLLQVLVSIATPGVFSKNIIKSWLKVLLALSILRELTEWNG